MHPRPPGPTLGLLMYYLSLAPDGRSFGHLCIPTMQDSQFVAVDLIE